MATVINIEMLGLENFPAVKVLIFKGQIDESNLPEASKILDKIVEDTETKYILLNFKELEFINSKVIGYLASLYSNASEKAKKIVIVEANEGIMDILSLVGLTTIIDHYDTLEEAVEIIKTDMEQEGVPLPKILKNTPESPNAAQNTNPAANPAPEAPAPKASEQK